ncbi:MAG: hypothetical protein ACBZ72_09840 [Candidatus Bathyarchaeia archaeon]
MDCCCSVVEVGGVKVGGADDSAGAFGVGEESDGDCVGDGVDDALIVGFVLSGSAWTFGSPKKGAKFVVPKLT